jgi:hypothetical protein
MVPRSFWHCWFPPIRSLSGLLLPVNCQDENSSYCSQVEIRTRRSEYIYFYGWAGTDTNQRCHCFPIWPFALATKKQTRRHSRIQKRGEFSFFVLVLTVLCACVRACGGSVFALPADVNEKIQPNVHSLLGFSSIVPFVPVCSFCLWFLIVPSITTYLRRMYRTVVRF